MDKRNINIDKNDIILGIIAGILSSTTVWILLSLNIELLPAWFVVFTIFSIFIFTGIIIGYLVSLSRFD